MDKICWVLWLSERWAVLRNIICINKSPPGTGPHQSGLTPDLANKGMMQTWSLTAFLEHQFKCDHAVISMRYLHSAIISLCIGSSSQRSQRQHGSNGARLQWKSSDTRLSAAPSTAANCPLTDWQTWLSLSLSLGWEVLTFWQRQPPSREVQARLRGSWSLESASTNQRPVSRSRDLLGPIRGQCLTDTPSRGD